MTQSTWSSQLAQRIEVSRFAESPLEAIENCISMKSVSPPDPAKQKPTDVIVAVQSASVGWVDLLMSSGLYQHRLHPPYCPGLEYSGIVAWVGSEVKGIELGARVMVDPFLAGPRTSGDYQHAGGFSTFSVVPQEAIYPMPSHFSFAQGANFFGSYETAYHCLFLRGKIQSGDTVLIHGASGATGLAAVHLAKIAGATVIATGRNDEKLRVVQEQGADFVINSQDPETQQMKSFRHDVKDLTDGKGVDIVYDGVGGAISVESLRCLKFNGRFLLVGWAATPFVAKGKKRAPNPNQLPTNLIMMKGLQVLGCPTVISTQKDPSLRKPRLQQLLAWVKENKLRPFISHTYPWEQYKEAMKAKWKSQVIGGCVLQLPDYNPLQE